MRHLADRQAAPARLVASFVAVVLMLCGLGGCASTEHARYTDSDVFKCEPGAPTEVSAHPGRQAAPRLPGPTLHIIEFDDQGWPFPAPGATENASPSFRIDCAIDDIAGRLKRDRRKVLIFVFVHGWQHTAAPGDRDLGRFRATLAAQQKRHGSERDVIGIYVGWSGRTLDFPGLAWTTFYSRKNAAHHIAEGSVRELFARLQALRNRWNRNSVAQRIGVTTCDRDKRPITGPDCPIRTVMTGHSFGAWILYASTAPYIMQTLAGGTSPARPEPEAPDDAGAVTAAPKDSPDTERERGIADLILLINPAFEATRYNAVFNAARAYRNRRFEPPLLVSVTSTADQATASLFPAARTLNTVLQHSPPTDLERTAIRRTHGHMERYLSHELVLDQPWPAGPDYQPCADAAAGSGPRAALVRRQYVCALQRHDAGMLPARPLERLFCGGLRLTWLANPDVDPFSVVWNIRTHGNVIPDHSSIHEPPMEYLVEQLYEDTGALPRFDLTRGSPSGAQTVIADCGE